MYGKFFFIQEPTTFASALYLTVIGGISEYYECAKVRLGSGFKVKDRTSSLKLLQKLTEYIGNSKFPNPEKSFADRYFHTGMTNFQ